MTLDASPRRVQRVPRQDQLISHRIIPLVRPALEQRLVRTVRIDDEG